ncbi:MAG: hypothetical protein GX638_18710, partial [Crenarchaeota archaeon]|nr:hypothetical protein [Thermoproteota archaeon]
MRPFVIEATKHFRNVYLRTPFPELYWDRNDIKFVEPECKKLKTQRENVSRQPEEIWTRDIPDDHTTLQFNYQQGFGIGKSIMQSFAEQVPFDCSLEMMRFQLPVNPKWIIKAKKVLNKIKTKKQICLVKFPTLKDEWKTPARNPHFHYFNRLIEEYKSRYYFISLADLRDNAEWFTGTPSSA